MAAKTTLSDFYGRFKILAGSARFGKIYAFLALGVLVASTIFWSVLGAKLQQGNADQLANTYLSNDSATFHNALLSGSHSFLVKWPLFMLVKVFGASATTFSIFTVLVSLLTVLVLAGILYRIERRPLVFGSLCLALASVLLLVPAQPYAGALLPVNMAMLATRNLEYVLYIVGLLLVVKSKRFRSWEFWLGVVVLVILMASDKLFLTLSVGGGLLALTVYALSSGWNLVSLSARWLVGGLLAGIGAIGLLWLVNAAGVTNISSQTTFNQYGLLHSPHDLLLGIVYGFLGVFTNFGANPAFDATFVRNIPHQTWTHLSGVYALSYLINFMILAFGCFTIWKYVKSSLAHNKNSESPLDDPSKLSVILIWTSMAAIAAFIFSNHYYAVDARYLGIVLFAIFISAATFSRGKDWRPERIVISGLVILIGAIFGLLCASRLYHADQAALASINSRNSTIAQVLSHHPTSLLVGDYWRVLPIKLQAKTKLKVMPLANCTTPRDILSSTAWQPNLEKIKFVYLLSVDPGPAAYPGCSLKQVVGSYGRPNASVLISGSLSHPKELLLFYDHGKNNSAPTTPQPPQGPATVLPITPDQLPYTSCPVPTDMNIVAHQDDDLLFMNPDIAHAIKDGHCVRTVYITAGDAGHDRFYWLGREQGSETAYDSMDGPGNDIWVHRIVKLGDNQFVTVANPRGNSHITLIFMHLPDGNLNGSGFKASRFESLVRLEAGKVSQIQAVDGQSSYTSAQLTQALTTLMFTYRPTSVRTQSNYVSKKYPDHSDHMAVGRYTKKAYQQYEQQQFEGQVIIPLKYYVGYPIHQFTPNVSGSDLQQKETTFFNYAKYDGGVCQTMQLCIKVPTYSSYLARQYQNPY